MQDEHGNPVIYDVRDRKTRESVIGAPRGTVLTDGRTGRRFTITEKFPLDPDYVKDRDYLTLMKEKAARARAAKETRSA